MTILFYLDQITSVRTLDALKMINAGTVLSFQKMIGAFLGDIGINLYSQSGFVFKHVNFDPQLDGRFVLMELKNFPLLKLDHTYEINSS